MPPIREELTADEQKFFDSEGEHVPADVKPEPEVKEEPAAKEKPDAKEVKTEPDSGAVKKDDFDSGKEKTVPLAALQEERAARKAAEERQRKNEETSQKRLDLIAQTLEAQKPKPAAPEAPDLEKDPLGAIKLNSQQIKELMDFKNDFDANQKQENDRNTLRNEAIRQESEYVKANPDYFAAGQFLKTSREAELAATGMYNPQQIGMIISNETFALAQQALQSGKNPAESVYMIAQARGYKKAEAAPEKKDETEADKIARIAAGQQAGKSLSQAGGGALASGQKLDAKTLANMSDEDFEKVYSKLSAGDQKALFGD